MLLQNGHTHIVELLLNTQGIEVNAKRNYEQTPLHLAAIVSYKLIHISFM